MARYFGVGKGSVIKTLISGYKSSATGNVDVPFQQVINEATDFIFTCYSINDSKNMSHTRLLEWGKEWERSYMFIHEEGQLSSSLVMDINENFPPKLNPEEFG